MEHRVRKKQLGALALTAALAVATPLGALAQPDDNALRLSLGYDGKLLFKVLDIQVEARANAQGFSATSRLVSYGVLRAFKHVDQRASSQGRMAGGAPEPGVFETQNMGGKTHRRMRVVWSARDVAMIADPPFANLGDPPATREQALAAADPLTQLMRITFGASRERTCARSYLFFDGKQLYDLDFANARDGTPGAREKRLGLTHMFRCDVRFREIAGFGKKPAARRNQGLERPINVDFAEIGDEGVWVLSGLHAQTPLGWAAIELSRMSLAGRVPKL